MRVAVVTTSYPSFPGDCAGHFVRQEALELASNGCEVHVIAPSTDSDALCDDPLVVWRAPHAGAFGWPGAVSRLRSHPLRVAGVAAFGAVARRRLRELAPDRVIAHWLIPCAWPIAAWATRAALEAVAHGADVRALLAMPSIARERIVGRLLDCGMQLRFVASALRQELCRELAPATASRVMAASFVRPASLTIPPVNARASELRASCGKTILASAVGRLVPAKRLELAIEAANLIAPRVQLCVVGDGPDAARLRSLDRSGNVSFVGRLQREETLAWIAASDVLLHPSGVEAAPTVVREARALGTAVVACASGDVERWAREDSGIRIVPPDAAAMASGMLAVQETCA